MALYDMAVVGAGVVGLASARELVARKPGLRLAVIDKEPRIGAHQTGHNSGVIHSGIYYTPGSLKARLCVAGSRELYAYCESRGIRTERCGKVIVATEEQELGRLQDLHRRGLANGVEGLELVGPERLRELEPHSGGIAALWSPNAGIVDYSAVASHYSLDVRNGGGEIHTGRRLTGLRTLRDRVVLETSEGELEARRVLTCAGLQADRVAALSGGGREPRVVAFRGDYWQLRPQARHLCRNMIYPVPDPAFPFLGVHATRRIGTGEIWLGPNAVAAFAREGYRRRDVAVRDLLEALGNPGFRRLARAYWRTGAQEMWRDFSKRAFCASVQRYIPEVTLGDMVPGPSGVRAQALDASGRLIDDFVVEAEEGRVLHVRNAPSPAATSSLAIGRLIADAAEEAFGERAGQLRSAATSPAAGG
ncbi:L-2-hydroxyglutarate oxidase [Candidatus Nephthysia bennettiae]|uniref:L-2-hydroxyglutarate oxidase n=1 Tax=Candidatus Nephthysia bennettiae TaxID=3127016 RepID=A0A934N5M4_9BACT|nr:L-2-hydroxyglutarate oxidase [Candidatus Dormibacteraeota bacterium]MBJ7614944.1 L-2-hydroxyglutarate oxidase [Candidatus Dormibacteraeota bacterium]